MPWKAGSSTEKNAINSCDPLVFWVVNATKKLISKVYVIRKDLICSRKTLFWRTGSKYRSQAGPLTYFIKQINFLTQYLYR